MSGPAARGREARGPGAPGRPLDGRAVIVTGGARGIGLGIARAVAEAGGRVAIVDLDGDAAEGAAEGLRADGVDAAAFTADIADAGAAARAVAAAADRFGTVDGLVNNAGVIRMAPALDTDPAEWDLHYRVNLLGTVHMCRAAADRMIADGHGGAIVNVASNAGKVGYPNMAAYNATKAAVINLTRSLAAEWAPHDINVNAVCPGGVATPMLHEVADWVADRIDGDAEALFGQMVPAQLGRHVEPIEVGRVVAFLLSPHAAIIRGQSINTDGGDTPY